MMRVLWLIPVVLLAACAPVPQYAKLLEFQFVTQQGQRLSVLCLHGSRADAPLPGTYECDIGERIR